MLRTICSYCKTELRTLIEPGKCEERISHGICRNCLEKVVAGKGETLDTFLDSLPAPVFVVNQEGRMVTANRHGQETVAKDLSQIAGHLGGEVFGCSYAQLPGGCGETIHCQSCTIRRTVMRTHTTGKLSVKIPACQDLDTVVGPRRIRFYISTEKVGAVVLLRIDDAVPAD